MAGEWRAGIKHVVLLMLENRSFDHMLGDLTQVHSELEGVDRNAAQANINRYQRRTYKQAPGASSALHFDPKHERPYVVTQLSNGNGGFVEAAAQAYPHLGPADWGEVMQYHALDTLPALHALAREFTVCDHWHASVPGPTWPNRLFALSGTSLGRVAMPDGLLDWNLHWYDQTTLFDRLNQKKGLDWRVYYGDAPLSFLLAHQLEAENRSRHFRMHQFHQDAAGDPKAFPSFALIEPAYFQPGATDDHPPHDVVGGETLIADVYNALRRNEDLWNETLLVILYDEHGGFYDHVIPGVAVPPDHHADEYTFDKLGVRVPALLVSPWIGKGVFHDTLDHTALLRFLIDHWGLGPLGARAAAYKSTFEGAFLNAPRSTTPTTIPAAAPNARTSTPTATRLTGHQRALVALSHAVESISKDAKEKAAGRLAHSLVGAQAAAEMAIERFEGFIDDI